MKIRKSDIIVLIVCVVIFGGLTLFTRFSKDEGAYVTVWVDGELYDTYSLDTDGEYMIEGYDGGHNLLIIHNGAAFVSEADCPDGLCINQKAISLNGETICCLPNRVIAEVVSDTENEVDAVAR